MEYYEFRAMTTDIQLAAEGDSRSVQVGFEAVASWIKSCEERFTRFTETSELAELNRSQGRWFQASQDMFDMLSVACELVDQTTGIFDPSILPDMEKAGYDRSIKEIQITDYSTELIKTSPNQYHYVVSPRKHYASFSSARLNSRDRSIRLQPGMRIDLGGIAKGWIAEKAAYKLAAYANSCLVNIGGDLFMLGKPEVLPSWQVSLEDPKNPSHVLAVLCIQSPMAVATSSVVKRRWLQSNRLRNHLIDPRTGESVNTDWLCVTAITPHGAHAEAFAKALLIGGSKEASIIAQGCPQLAYIAVDDQGDLWGSENSKEYLYVSEKL